MSVSGEKKHMWQMHYTLLSSRHERKSQKSYALLRSQDASASPSFSVAPRLGWTAKTSTTWQESKLAILADPL
jgi:hypothetical protein